MSIFLPFGDTATIIPTTLHSRKSSATCPGPQSPLAKLLDQARELGYDVSSFLAGTPMDPEIPYARVFRNG